VYRFRAKGVQQDRWAIITPDRHYVDPSGELSSYDESSTYSVRFPGSLAEPSTVPRKQSMFRENWCSLL
jgi:hypothetical protein